MYFLFYTGVVTSEMKIYLLNTDAPTTEESKQGKNLNALHFDPSLPL